MFSSSISQIATYNTAILVWSAKIRNNNLSDVLPKISILLPSHNHCHYNRKNQNPNEYQNHRDCHNRRDCHNHRDGQEQLEPDLTSSLGQTFILQYEGGGAVDRVQEQV